MTGMKLVLISKLSWGKIEVEINGETYQFRDCKIWPGGAREWDWNETGTHHSPGIQVADIQEILEKDVGIIILSRGQRGRLQVKEETKSYLRQQDVMVHVEETNRAVDRFNELSRQGKRVGGVFHSTC